MRSRLLPLLACGLLAQGLAAQSPWLIRGKVLDEQGGILYPVAITWDAQAGTINEPDGSFRIETEELPASLLFSLLGYADKEIFTNSLPAQAFASHQVNLRIELRSVASQLKGVEITAAKEKKLMGSTEVVPLDFAFLDSRILVLTRQGRSYQMRLLDEQEKEVFLDTLPYAANTLFTSCLGGIHAVGDTVCQELVVDSSGVHVLRNYPREQFDKVIYPCVAHQSDKFIVREITHFEKITSYSWVDTVLHLRRPLYTVYDEASLTNVLSRLRDLVYDFCAHSPDASRLSFDGHFPDEVGFEEYIIDKWSREGLKDNYFDLVKMASNATRWQAMSHIRQLLMFPEKAELIRGQDSIFIFDPVKPALIPYGWSMQGGSERRISLPEGADKHPKVLIDELNRRVYWKGKNRLGFLQAIEWNIHDGKEIARFEAKNMHEGIQHFKIRDGYLYYIANPSPTDRYRFLFKNRLIKVGESRK